MRCQELSEQCAVRQALEQGAEAHNVKSVLFDTALLHILRISRILSIPKASLLLVGICGSDRSSLAKLASYLCGVTLMSQASQTPGHASTRTDVLVSGAVCLSALPHTRSSLSAWSEQELVRSAHRLAGTKSVDVCLLLSTVACKDRIDILVSCAALVLCCASSAMLCTHVAYAATRMGLISSCRPACGQVSTAVSLCTATPYPVLT